jgi:hypothetical protein
MVFGHNPHRLPLWGFLFVCPPMLFAWCPVHPVLARSIPSGVNDSLQVRREVLMRLDPGSLYDYEARAQQVLPHDYWDVIAGGSKDELTTQRNRSAFDAISLRPRLLRDVTARQLATTVLGTPISFPVMVSPTGGHKLAHPEGECATARGAGMSQTLMMLSTSSHCSLEDVAKAATGP